MVLFHRSLRCRDRTALPVLYPQIWGASYYLVCLEVVRLSICEDWQVFVVELVKVCSPCLSSMQIQHRDGTVHSLSQSSRNTLGIWGGVLVATMYHVL